ncbi:uncharacterized protein THITE_2108049 [Thermothielavioides terrestris NRRL 8126]|uniref:FAD-binding PCMH-type domain-containing protein n=1 Tax=Thermothielavioides terrestris (strain ATCC 38088 / NRRL 8126) TaxID=578455 RepID=G2QXC9_THETT|nr:uncharacterized protein THITE_2108049 [Thermothielavioides terrestris NRRL 8126]AEO63152.1 hypothetical protein THITE_2108049 [Thermothielavioides terrestris NRRL 8126]
MCWFRADLVAAAVVALAAATATASAAPAEAVLATSAATPSAPPAAATSAAHCSLSDLEKQLSGIEIYLPGSDQFTQYSARWSNVGAPIVNVTVLPATENDVVQIVSFANKCNIPFLAYNGVHGSITTLGRMSWGIDINLSLLSGITIAADGQTATIAGGTNSKVVVDTLWAAGKQTVTGTCECVSYMGPALGGGHGWLQGRHGLVADQWVSMNIVLANGTLTTIDANSDLWWAVRGAGHNFGIVTSVTVKIYPRVYTNWAIETITFTGDKVKAVYQAINDYLLRNGTQPVDVTNWSYWFNDPAVDPNGPVIQLYIIQEGVTAVDPTYTQPFHALGPVSVVPDNGTYLDLAGWVGITLASPPCQKAGLANPRFPIYLRSYNATAQQAVYSAFAAATNASSPFANSLFMFEGYPTEGVRAVDPDSSAYAFRTDNDLLIAPLIQYTPAGPDLDRQAEQLGNQLRNILLAGSGSAQLNTYVNYAYGDEQPQAWYGYDQWRLDRLKALKAKYDPHNRFGFYAPVV